MLPIGVIEEDALSEPLAWGLASGRRLRAWVQTLGILPLMSQPKQRLPGPEPGTSGSSVEEEEARRATGRSPARCAPLRAKIPPAGPPSRAREQLQETTRTAWRSQCWLSR